jgi:hypothetical protein
MTLRTSFFRLSILSVASLVFASLAAASSICPSTASTNTDCGFVFTIGPGGSISGSPVYVSPGVIGAPYDGSDDALIGVINHSGAIYTGSFNITGSGNGGGLFAFDGDGICTFVAAPYCATAPTGYEGPLTTFSNINANGTSGTVNIAGLGIGATTFFSLEGSPASITPTIGPEPGTTVLLGAGLLLLGVFSFKSRIFGSRS